MPSGISITSQVIIGLRLSAFPLKRKAKIQNLLSRWDLCLEFCPKESIATLDNL